MTLIQIIGIYIYIYVISSQIMVLPHKFPEFVFFFKQVENVGSQQVHVEFLDLATPAPSISSFPARCGPPKNFWGELPFGSIWQDSINIRFFNKVLDEAMAGRT